MREIISFDIETDSVMNERGTSGVVPCVMSNGMQAQTASVQITIVDTQSDTALAISIQNSIDQDEYIHQAVTSSYNSAKTVIIPPFDCSGLGFLRAKVTNAGATATLAKVTFILTRTN